jgi:hypothetical protein
MKSFVLLDTYFSRKPEEPKLSTIFRAFEFSEVWTYAKTPHRKMARYR